MKFPTYAFHIRCRYDIVHFKDCRKPGVLSFLFACVLTCLNFKLFSKHFFRLGKLEMHVETH